MVRRENIPALPAYDWSAACPDLGRVRALCAATHKEPHLRTSKDVQKLAELAQSMPVFRTFSPSQCLKICKVSGRTTRPLPTPS